MTISQRHLIDRLRAGLVIALALSTPAMAALEPRVKPEPRFASAHLNSVEFRALRDGMVAASNGDWSSVRDIRSSMSNSAGSKLLLWRRATSDPSMRFSELRTALDELQGWPRQGTIQTEAEKKIGAAGLSASDTIAWFDTYPARSGAGKAVLASALITSGRVSEGENLLRETWRGSVLSVSEQGVVLSRHSNRLTTADHVERVNYLLWSGQRSAARRLLSQLPAGERRLAEARIKLMGREGGVDAAIARVPSSLQAHPGLLYERARWRRGSRRTTAALPLVLQIPSESGPAAARSKVWRERKIHISRTMSNGEHESAYQLAANNGLSRGTSFAEAEWLAGWIALRHLDDPNLAAQHFERLEDGVTTPISLARAAYWRGQAAEASGRASTALTHFTRAGAYTTTFYGQLAARRIEGDKAVAWLPPAARPSRSDRQAFRSREVPQALALLSELDQLSLFREFAYHLDDTLERPAEFALLAEMAREYHQGGVATRSGKTGLSQGVIEPGAAYPVIDLSAMPNDAPEPAFVHALIRQESEFYQRAVSPVGARGLMQLMPRTASSTARSRGQSYRRNWLIDDVDYNIEIGSAHLADLLEEFDGSYILAAAAYNAGASRARRWVSQNGDPRGGEVDPIEWVESIPFSETRNYVQRVMENLQVYRARLGDGTATIELPADLERGGSRRT